MRSTRLWLLVFVFGFLGGLFGELYHSKVLAARNAGGNYTLPSPQNPVVTGTTIKSTDFNTTMNDIGSELTNSLDRSGRGCMTGAIQSANGTKAAPGVTWCSETGSGLYRNASQDIRMSVNATDGQQWTPGASTVFGTGAVALTVTGDTSGSFNGLVVTGSASSGAILATGGTQGTLNTVGWRALQGVGGTGNGTGAGGLGLRGVGGTGGATSGTGGAGAVLSGGAGGAPNGIGGIGGSAQGNSGVGTGAGGDGFTSTGGTAPGAGAGGNGITATGGTSASGASGPGGFFANGVAATGGTRQDAIVLSNGDLKLDGVTAPNSNIAIKNRLTVASLVKAWGFLTTVGSSGTSATCTVTSGFNIASCSVPTSGLVDVTMAQAMASNPFNGVVFWSAQTVGACSGASAAEQANQRTASVFGMLSPDNFWTNLKTCTVSVMVLGLQ